MYILRRLLPFGVFSIGLELLYKTGLMAFEADKPDFAAAELLKTFGVMLLTTAIATLYMLIPYMLFLLSLPAARRNGKLDRAVTVFMYASFVFALLFEKTASFVFWDEFSAAFNFIAVDYLVYTNEVIANIYQSYPVNLILSALLAATAAIVWLTKRFLFPAAGDCGPRCRLSAAAVYALLCLAAYRFVDMANLEANRNFYNAEISKNGTYSLFSAFLKNELDYASFYPVQDVRENLKILHKKFAAPNVRFLAPEKGISRHIGSYRPENRANVIVVLMESMSAKYLDENQPEGMPEITPNLSRLSRKGLFFSNAYATGTRSVRGIEAVTLSVPPLPGMSIVRRQKNENLFNIGSVFAEKGYDNKWIYGGYGYFDNMNYFFGHNGFQVVDRAVWDKDEVTFANAWGAADEDTFAKVIREADKSYAAGKPFLTVLLTISNHRPYTYPEGRIDIPSEKGGRLGGVKYADYAVGQFVKEAKSKPWFDNTLFVFVADHTAGAAGKEEISLEGHHIPFIIYAPKLVKARRIDMPVSQIDVLPTLLGLLNFDYDSRFYGQDALSANYEPRFFVSNYQKVGYVKNGVNVILKPVRRFSYEPGDADPKTVDENLKEGIAFYQQADRWEENMRCGE